MTRKLKKGSFMALYTFVIIAAVIIFSLIVRKPPIGYLKHDLSSNKILTLGDTTRGVLAQLDRDVTIHIVADPNPIDKRIPSFAELYRDLSPYISVETDDLVLHPDILALLDIEPDSLIVSCESTGKETSISFDDIIQFDPMVYYQYGQVKETTSDGEGQVTSAIRHVTSDTAATVYTLTGHGEAALVLAVTDAVNKSGTNVAELNLLTQGAIPQDYSLLIMNALARDISAGGKEIPTDYLKSDGRILLLTGCTQDTLANLTDFIPQHGMDLKNGFVADPAPQHFYDNDLFSVIPDCGSVNSLLSGIDSSVAALLVQSARTTMQENPSEHTAVQPFLIIPGSAFLVDSLTQEKAQGIHMLRAMVTETVNEEEGIFSMLTVITVLSMTDDPILSRFPSITSLTLFMNAAANGLPGVTPLSIPGKSLDITYNMVTSTGLWDALFITAIPVIFLAAGLVIWLKRRKL